MMSSPPRPLIVSARQLPRITSGPLVPSITPDPVIVGVWPMQSGGPVTAPPLDTAGAASKAADASSDAVVNLACTVSPLGWSARAYIRATHAGHGRERRVQ